MYSCMPLFPSNEVAIVALQVIFYIKFYSSLVLVNKWMWFHVSPDSNTQFFHIVLQFETAQELLLSSSSILWTGQKILFKHFIPPQTI